jgi:hypothetical protein
MAPLGRRRSSMGETPFRLVFGLDPRMDFMEIDASGVVDPNALDGARSLKERRDRAREAKARECYYDKFHRPATFQEGDPTPERRNVTSEQEARCSSVEPCKVLAKVGPQAYRIRLPIGSDIHRVSSRQP